MIDSMAASLSQISFKKKKKKKKKDININHHSDDVENLVNNYIKDNNLATSSNYGSNSGLNGGTKSGTAGSDDYSEIFD